MNEIITDSATAVPFLRPLHDRVLVKRLSQPVKDGLIWIPDIAQENTKYAEVIAIGPKVRGVKPGDEVLVPGIAAKYPDWEQSELMMIQEGDIGGIITNS